MPRNMIRVAYDIVQYLRANVEGAKYGVSKLELEIAIIKVAGGSELSQERYTKLLLSLGFLIPSEDGYEIVDKVVSEYA